MGKVAAGEGVLKENILKQLLEDIEASDQKYSKFDLIAHCNDEKNKGFFGKPNSDLRNALRKQFERIKKKDIDAYLNYIHSKKVAPGKVTQQLKRESGATPLKEDSDDDESFEVEEEDDDDDVEEEKSKLHFRDDITCIRI